MEGMNITYILQKHRCKPISAQTVPNTYAFINCNSLLAEQVGNRSSAQWKKANFIVCSRDKSILIKSCLYGWKLLASGEGNQILFLQGDNGIYNAYDWNGYEIKGNHDEIVSKYKILQ